MNREEQLPLCIDFLNFESVTKSNNIVPKLFLGEKTIAFKCEIVHSLPMKKCVHTKHMIHLTLNKLFNVFNKCERLRKNKHHLEDELLVIL